MTALFLFFVLGGVREHKNRTKTTRKNEYSSENQLPPPPPRLYSQYDRGENGSPVTLLASCYTFNKQTKNENKTLGTGKKASNRNVEFCFCFTCCDGCLPPVFGVVVIFCTRRIAFSFCGIPRFIRKFFLKKYNLALFL